MDELDASSIQAYQDDYDRHLARDYELHDLILHLFNTATATASEAPR